MEKDLSKIIEQCKANDHKAFELIYKRYFRTLLGIALRYSGSRAEAEDILQDAFIKIFHSIGSYSAKGSFEGWMKRIVQNTAINNFRGRLKVDLYVDLSDQQDRMGDSSAEAIFESFDVKDTVVLLNRMPEGYRMAINLYFIDGYSHKEISELLGISIGASKSQLFKAKNYLKKLIETHNEKIS